MTNGFALFAPAVVPLFHSSTSTMMGGTYISPHTFQSSTSSVHLDQMWREPSHFQLLNQVVHDAAALSVTVKVDENDEGSTRSLPNEMDQISLDPLRRSGGEMWIELCPQEILIEICSWAMELKCAKTMSLVHPRFAEMIRPMLLSHVEISSNASLTSLLRMLHNTEKQQQEQFALSTVTKLAHSLPLWEMPRIRSLKIYATRPAWKECHALIEWLQRDRRRKAQKQGEEEEWLPAVKTSHTEERVARKETADSRIIFGSLSDAEAVSPSTSALGSGSKHVLCEDRLELDELSVRFQGSDLANALQFYELVSPKRFEWMTSPVWMIRPATLFQRFLSQWPQLHSVKLGGFLYDESFARALSGVRGIASLELHGSANTHLDVDVIGTLLDPRARIGPSLKRLSFGGCPARRRNLLELEMEQRRRIRTGALVLEHDDPGQTVSVASGHGNAGGEGMSEAEQLALSVAALVPPSYIDAKRQLAILRWKELEITRTKIDWVGDPIRNARTITPAHRF